MAEEERKRWFSEPVGESESEPLVGGSSSGPSTAASSGTEDLVFAMRSLAALLPPVLAAMVASSMSAVLIPNVVAGDTGYAAYSVYDTEEVSSADSTSTSIGEAMVNALVITAILCGASIVLLALYKYRCGFFLQFYLMFSSLTLLSIMGGFMAFCFLVTAQIPTDTLTFVLLFWNFGAVGVASVYYQKGLPAWLSQAYLVLVSVIMAWHIVQLEEWTTWCLLVMLAFYDLAAVMAPCGPLKWLVKVMHERGETLPGLLFETEVHEDGAPDEHAHRGDGDRELTDEAMIGGTPGPEPQLALKLHPTQEVVTVGAGSLGLLLDKRFSHLAVIKGFSAVGGEDERGEVELSGRVHPPSVIVRVDRVSTSSMSLSEVAQILKQTSHLPSREVVVQNADYDWSGESAQDPESFALRATSLGSQRARKTHPVRLGLGDFVFYSVLASRAAMFSMATLVASCLAILIGLGVTLSALSLYRKALPALPTSIMFGVLAFVLTRYMVVPELVVATDAGLCL